jgi:soluble lytic murein transglycosylase-like protein
VQKEYKVSLLLLCVICRGGLFSQVFYDAVQPETLKRGSVVSKKYFYVEENIFNLVSSYSKIFNINSNLIFAIIHTESNFNPLAVSNKGAQGLMQIMPETFQELKGENPFDSSDNIRCGVKYFYRLLSSYKNIRLALAAYNAGPGSVKNVIPNFKETKSYVKKVLTNHQNFSYKTNKEN